LLAVTIGAFFYIGYLVNQKNSRLTDISEEAAKIKTEEQKKLENNVFSTRRKINDFAKIIDQRKVSTGFFKRFEELILPEIYFSQCKLDLAQTTAELSGHAKTFQSLGQQLAIFEKAEDAITSVVVQKTGINDEGGVDFSVTIGVNRQAIAFK